MGCLQGKGNRYEFRALVSFSDLFGIILGSFWNDFGIILGVPGESLGSPWGLLGGFLGEPGGVWHRSGTGNPKSVKSV